MGMHRCEVCGDEFDSERGLHVHQTAVHGEHTEEVNEGGSRIVPDEFLTTENLILGILVSAIIGVMLGGMATYLLIEDRVYDPAETVDATEGDRIWEDSIRRGEAPTEGSDSAKLDIIIYQDYSCEECRTFTMNGSYLDSIRERYVDSGTARLIWRFYPGDTMQDEVLLECVHRHSPRSFDQLRKILLNTNRPAERPNDLDIFEQARIQECRNSRSARQDVQLQKQTGTGLGINNTPGLIIDDKESKSYWYVNGLRSPSRYHELIEEALQ